MLTPAEIRLLRKHLRDRWSDPRYFLPEPRRLPIYLGRVAARLGALPDDFIEAMHWGPIGETGSDGEYVVRLADEEIAWIIRELALDDRHSHRFRWPPTYGS